MTKIKKRTKKEVLEEINLPLKEKKAYWKGFEEGILDGRQEVLDYLENILDKLWMKF